MTYDELVQAVQDFTVNTNTTFVNNIPRFIASAEEQIVRHLPMANFRKAAEANFTASNEYLSTPSDYLAPYEFLVTDGSGNEDALLPKDVSFIREAFPDRTAEGLPRFYAVFDDDTFIVAPTPDSTYAVELHYYYDPAGLTSGNPTTWISTNAENSLLYGTLFHAYVFMKGDADLMEHYKGLFNDGKIDMGKMGGERQKTDHFKDSKAKA